MVMRNFDYLIYLFLFSENNEPKRAKNIKIDNYRRGFFSISPKTKLILYNRKNANK